MVRRWLRGPRSLGFPGEEMRALLCGVGMLFVAVLGAGCDDTVCQTDAECAGFGEGWTCVAGANVCVGPGVGRDGGGDGREDAGTGDAGADAGVDAGSDDAGTRTCPGPCPTGQRCIDGECQCDGVSCPNGCCREGVCGALSECGTCGTCTWSPGPEMHAARRAPVFVKLQSGAILTAGGPVRIHQDEPPSARAELLETAPDRWVEVGAMTVARSQHAMAALPSSGALVCGGTTFADGEMVEVSTCERFDELTRTFVPAPAMTMPRSDFALASIGSDGSLIAVGGRQGSEASATAELFDAVSGTWRRIDGMHAPLVSPFSISLSANETLFAANPLKGQRPATIFNASVGAWTALPSVIGHFGGAALVRDVTAIITGGRRDDPFVGPAIGSATRLQIGSTASWFSIAEMQDVRTRHALVRLRSGGVLAIGGSTGGLQPVLMTSVEAYQSGSNIWTRRSSLNAGRMDHKAALLSDGRVIVFGGVSEDGVVTSTEVLH